MTQILHLIQNNANLFIVVSGVILAALLMWNGVVLSEKRSRIEEALFSKENRYLKDTIRQELIRQEDTDARPTPDKIRSLETDFNNACSVHDVLVQFIPIFPLLGILGTVVGLMLEVQAGDVAKMMASLDTALTSTFWGLVFAILLKVIEAVFPSRIINYVDVMLEDFGKRMNLADAFQDSEADK